MQQPERQDRYAAPGGDGNQGYGGYYVRVLSGGYLSRLLTRCRVEVMVLRRTIMREADMAGSKSGRCSRRRGFMSRRWGRRRRSKRGQDRRRGVRGRSIERRDVGDVGREGDEAGNEETIG